jgi:hypothetical protein
LNVERHEYRELKHYSKIAFELPSMEREPNGAVFHSSFGLSDYAWKRLLGLAKEWDCRQHMVLDYALLLLPPDVESPDMFKLARMEVLSKANADTPDPNRNDKKNHVGFMS